ncbi:NADH dehydrogenase [Spirosoma humi]
MFGLDPLNQTVAFTEIVLLLAFAAFVGWLLGRLARSGRVSSLRKAIAAKEAELADCRQSKLGGHSPQVVVPPVSTVDVPRPFVHADPLLPAISNDDTPDLIDEEVDSTTKTSLTGATASESAYTTPAVIPVLPVGAGVPDNSEAAVLSRIAARAGEVNFDRIGRAVATEADDLKDIVGIGPFLERKLHSLGIYTFRQIANFTREDVNKVNELIEFFPGRIERDSWVEQAKRFYERKAR